MICNLPSSELTEFQHDRMEEQLVGDRDSEKEGKLTSDKDVSGEAKPIRWAITEGTRETAEILSDSLDADIIFYNGPLDDPYDWLFIEACAGRFKRENVFLILVTSGGSADSAFRIADWLQKHYKRFTLYVTGRCKSAGTLVAMGAHELIMSPDHGELGPLDVQLSAPEEPSGRRSGLTFSDALSRLDDEAYLTYENFLSRIIENDDGEVSREYAMKIASDMADCSLRPDLRPTRPASCRPGKPRYGHRRRIRRPSAQSVGAELRQRTPARGGIRLSVARLCDWPRRRRRIV